MVTNYRVAREQNKEAVRRGLLDAASRVLVTEGLAALTMRRIADEVVCSTKVLYTLFGNKEGLFNQLYLEGLARLRTVLEAVTDDGDLLVYITQLGRAYRDFARANPTYYAVLFNQAVPGFRPNADGVNAAMHTFDVLVRAVQRGMATGIFATGDPDAVAKAVWAALHGAVSLELGGYFDDHPVPPETYFDLTIQTMITGFVQEAHARSAT